MDQKKIQRHRLECKKEAETGESGIVAFYLENRPDIYTDNEYDFIEAIRNNDLTMINKYINDGIDVGIMGGYALKVSIKK